MTIDSVGLELGNVLTWLSRRQEVIAANIANADTPGYQTRDVNPPGDFESALADAGATVTTAPDLPSRNDGNNVSIDREARLLARNSLEFNVTAQLLRSQFRVLRSAIEDGRAS